MDKTVYTFVRSFERIAWSHGVSCQRVEEVSWEVRFILRAGCPPFADIAGKFSLSAAVIRQVEVAVSCLFARVRFQDAWTRLFTL